MTICLTVFLVISNEVIKGFLSYIFKIKKYITFKKVSPTHIISPCIFHPLAHIESTLSCINIYISIKQYTQKYFPTETNLLILLIYLFFLLDHLLDHLHRPVLLSEGGSRVSVAWSRTRSIALVWSLHSGWFSYRSTYNVPSSQYISGFPASAGLHK